MARRIQIKGVRRKEIDTNLLAYVYFLEGKRLVLERRRREAEAKAKRTGERQKDQGPGVRS
jgi:hypothetical protein